MESSFSALFFWNQSQPWSHTILQYFTLQKYYIPKISHQFAPLLPLSPSSHIDEKDNEGRMSLPTRNSHVTEIMSHEENEIMSQESIFDLENKIWFLNAPIHPVYRIMRLFMNETHCLNRNIIQTTLRGLQLRLHTIANYAMTSSKQLCFVRKEGALKEHINNEEDNTNIATTARGGAITKRKTVYSADIDGKIGIEYMVLGEKENTTEDNEYGYIKPWDTNINTSCWLSSIISLIRSIWSL